MSNTATITFPQFPQYKVLLRLYTNVSRENIKEIKQQLINANTKYDYCFLNTQYIISQEQLNNSIHKSILNYVNQTMQANNLNTEILLNLSPINVISDAIKRFGISEECSNTIVIKIMIDSPVDTGEFEQKVDDIIHGNSIKIDDNTLFNLVDISKFKKIYKLNDAKISNSNDKDLQGTLTRLAIGASIIRGL